MTQRPLQMLPVLLLLLLVPFSLWCSAAAAEPDYSITYTITVAPDGSALWRVEYRTSLPTDPDLSDFEAYARDLPAVHLPRFRDLMERSAAQAAVATGRHMAVSGVTGTAAVQTSPTGRYGVVVYSLRWEGFVVPGERVTVGDAFAGGLYLPKGNTLIVQYPDGYAVRAAEPVPDEERDGGLTWYGQRSFGAGEPRIVLEGAAFPVLPVAAGLAVVAGVTLTGWYLYRRHDRKAQGSRQQGQDPAPAVPQDAGTPVLEERIVQLLRTHETGMFQSDLVNELALPKSTVSTALNSLHARGLIVKVRKGRENLIRLV